MIIQWKIDLLSQDVLVRMLSQDTSCVLVHGVSSCDLGFFNILVYG
jgi:hypothetical protein